MNRSERSGAVQPDESIKPAFSLPLTDRSGRGIPAGNARPSGAKKWGSRRNGQGMPRTMAGPIIRVTRTGSFCHI
jgi:hypothetical protein